MSGEVHWTFENAINEVALPRPPATGKSMKLRYKAMEEDEFFKKTEQDLSKVIDMEYAATVRDGRRRKQGKHTSSTTPRQPNYAASVTLERLLASRVYTGNLPKGKIIQERREQADGSPPSPPPRANPAVNVMSSATPVDRVIPAHFKRPDFPVQRARLPNEMFIHCFQYLDYKGLCRVAVVCKSWNITSSADWLWRSISKYHKSKEQPFEEMSWKQAFARHISIIRRDLDEELAGLMQIVKRSDKKLNEAQAQDSDLYDDDEQLHMGVLRDKTAKLEAEMKVLKKEVEGAESLQEKLKISRSEQEVTTKKLCEKVEMLVGACCTLEILEARRAFLSRFQRTVIRACFEDSNPDEVPVAIRRGADTFSQMELVVAAIPSRGQPWDTNWGGFKRLFPLNLTWWDINDALLSPETRTTPGTFLNLAYAASSKHATVLRLMQDMLRTSTAALLRSFTQQPNAAFSNVN